MRRVAVRRANRVIGCGELVVLCIVLCASSEGVPGEYRKRRKGMRLIGGRVAYDKNLP